MNENGACSVQEAHLHHAGTKMANGLLPKMYKKSIALIVHAIGKPSCVRDGTIIIMN